MTAGPVNRALLESNFQNPGDVYDDTKTEGAFDVVADQIDDNWNYTSSLVTTGTLTPYPAAFYRKMIINGNMDIHQRGSSFTISSGSSAYTVDRMKTTNDTSGANATASHVSVTDLNNSMSGLQLVHAALPANQAKLMHFYTLEATDSYKIAGQTIYVQVKVKAVSGMNQAQLFIRYRTTEAALNTSSILVASSAVTPISTGAWTTITLTATLPDRTTLTPNGVIGFQIVGSKTTSEASGDGFIITQFDSNIGDVLTPFQPRSYQEELELCLRYYEKSGNTTDAVGAGTINTISANQVANNKISTRFSFKKKKRTTPTITFYDNSSVSGSANWVVFGTSSVSLVTVASTHDEEGFRLRSTATDSAAINVVDFRFTADAEL